MDEEYYKKFERLSVENAQYEHDKIWKWHFLLYSKHKKQDISHFCDEQPNETKYASHTYKINLITPFIMNNWKYLFFSLKKMWWDSQNFTTIGTNS